MSKLKKMTIIITVPILLLIACFASYSFVYGEKIYPNISIANTKLSGMSKSEAKIILSYKIDSVKNKDLELQYDEKTLTIKPLELNLEYLLDDILSSADSIGRQGNFFEQIYQRIELIFKPVNLNVAFKINQTNLDKTISSLSGEIDLPLKEATLKLENDQLITTDSQVGRTLEKGKLEDLVLKSIGNLDDTRIIVLPIKISSPQLATSDVQSARNKLELILSKKITISSQEKQYNLGKDQIFDWLELISDPIKMSGSKLEISFNEGKIRKYLSDLAKEINRDPIDAKLSYNTNNLKILSKSVIGYELDQSESLKTIVNTLKSPGKVAGISSDAPSTSNSNININLSINSQNPAISENNITDLGIKELISQGSTSYVGSPANRRYNIKVGAEMFNGVIIKSGEEFSFLKYLGDVSEERGFKKELVIKQDSTEPEVGGGLCQVSTTMFRAALNSGLKITERQNHKYRVSYYEPPVGLDATIYEPSPDLKFLNDTLGSILIQAEIKNDNKLTFYFYGTKDGREVSISEPQLYDYVSPPDPEYIDDPSLPQGEEKYKEKAHTGVKATVNYVVKKNGEVINQQTFNSKYTAWGAVILRGTGPAPEPVPEEPAESQPTT